MSDLTIQDLEIKLAFVERHAEEQDRVIHALRAEVEKLRKELARISDRLDSSSDSRQNHPPADEKPPHY